MSSPDGPGLTLRGPRVTLRPLTPDEVDVEWAAMLGADDMTIASLPDEQEFRDRLSRSGTLVEGWLDLAIDVGGSGVGRIQTFVPPGLTRDRTTYNIGIGLRDDARGRGYGGEALDLLTHWLFSEAAATRIEGMTDPANVAMQAVFRRLGWREDGVVDDGGRTWLLFVLTRDE